MHVGVLGGGLQGCCVAIALAERGARVTLIDNGRRLLAGTAVANEGKIHLGYTYAGDPGLATARTMVEGALGFAPFMKRYLGLSPDDFDTSSPCIYVVHRDTQRGVAEISAYLSGVHALLADSAGRNGSDYFGRDLRIPPRRWSKAECEATFDPKHALAAFDTQEIAVEPTSLACFVRDFIQSHSRIDVWLGREVQAVHDEGTRLRVVSACSETICRDSFDYVVNALWAGRLAVDATLGILPDSSWVYRFKYGFTFRSGIPRPLTATVVLGPFGDFVSYGSGANYLSWYPTCLEAMTVGANPPVPRAAGAASMLERARGSLRGLADIIPALRDIDSAAISDLTAKGGIIMARGKSDIDDRRSALHERSSGIMSCGRYHSIDTGKFTTAPMLAEMCADRIVIGS